MATWTFGDAPATYPNGLPIAGGTIYANIDYIRLLIGDVDESDQQLSDETITFLLLEQWNPHLAAACAAEMLESQYARYTQEKLGDWSANWEQQAAHFKDLALSLRVHAGRFVVAHAGGLAFNDAPGTDSGEDSALGVGSDTGVESDRQKAFKRGNVAGGQFRDTTY